MSAALSEEELIEPIEKVDCGQEVGSRNPPLLEWPDTVL